MQNRQTRINKISSFWFKHQYRLVLLLLLFGALVLTCYYQVQKDEKMDLSKVFFQPYSSPLFYTQTGQANLVTKKGRVLLFAVGEEVKIPRGGDYLASLDRNVGKLYLVDQDQGNRRLVADHVQHFKWLNSGKGFFYFKQTGVYQGENIGDYFYFDVQTKENYHLGSKIFQEGFIFAATGDVVLYRQLLNDEKLTNETEPTEEQKWVQHHLVKNKKYFFIRDNRQEEKDLIALHVGYRGNSAIFLHKNPQNRELSLLFYPNINASPLLHALPTEESSMLHLHIFSGPTGEEGSIQFANQTWSFHSDGKWQFEVDAPLLFQVDTGRVFQSNYSAKFGIGVYDWQFEHEKDLPWFGKVLGNKEGQLWYLKRDGFATSSAAATFWTLTKPVEALQFLNKNTALSIVNHDPYLYRFTHGGEVAERKIPLRLAGALDYIWQDKSSQYVFWSAKGEVYFCTTEDLLAFEEKQSGELIGQKVLSDWDFSQKENIVFAADGRNIYYLNQKAQLCHTKIGEDGRMWQTEVLASDVTAFIAVDIKSSRFVLARQVRAEEGEQTLCEIYLLEGTTSTKINRATYYPLPYFYFNFLQS